MPQIEKIIFQFLSGNRDSNISFSAIKKLLKHLGFSVRIKGDHHIFSKADIEEIINLQPIDNKAKAYQVKQVRSLIHKYKLNT